MLVERVCRFYGSVRAVDDVSFAIEGPGLVGILGPNGAGKTSLLDLLAGLASADSGSITLFGERIAPSRYPRGRVGVVLQREFVPDHVTVAEYAELFAALQGARDGGQRILDDARLAARASLPMARLSGGEAQRLFIATALVHAPELVLLDEPTSGLDPESKRSIGELLCERARRTIVILTTHDLREADRICDTCLFMVNGHVRAHGARAALLEAAAASDLEQAFFHYCGARLTPGGEVA